MVTSLKSISSRQTTVEREIVLDGIGVHSGKSAGLIIHPAEANSGYNFFIQHGGRRGHIPGDFRAVSNVTLCTVLSAGNATAATVEHLMASLRGMGVDNADIELDGPEVPIMDGSSAEFVDAIEEAGVAVLNERRRFIKVLRPIAVVDGDAHAELRPYDGFRIDIEIDFKSSLIGRQRLDLHVTPSSFKAKLSRARTFGFMKDVKQLWATGRALGSSLENTVALGEDRIMNPEGLRFPDEFVRHKALDAVGDLALAGAPILGFYRSVRGGHRLNSAMLHALHANGDAWTIVEAGDSSPRRPQAPRADFGIAFAAPNFAPQTV